MVLNRKVVLLKRPNGLPEPKHFEVAEDDVKTDLKQHEVLVRVEWIAVDPAQRMWISGRRTYYDPVAVGAVVNSYGVGQVISSKSPLFPAGSKVFGFLGWQEIAKVKASALTKIPPYDNPRTYLGVLGINGMAAYFGFFELAKPRKGDTIVVSAAAGSVGSLVCQLARMKQLRVIGIAGTDDKCDWVANDLGAAACINYKTTENLVQAIKHLCPQGVDIYFDNVGGAMLDAVLANINRFGRVVLCGALSSYNEQIVPPIYHYPYSLLRILISKSATIEGFIVWNFATRFSNARSDLSKWVAEKKIKFREHVLQGLASAPVGLRMLFTGENRGKLLIQMPDRPRL